MQILGRKAMLEEVRKNPGKYSVVAICEPGNKHEVEEILDKSDCIVVEFNDLTFIDYDSAPHPADLEPILTWAKNRSIDNMIVACAAGISRSSAVAFMILADRMPPEQAQTIWELGKHVPNELILHHSLSMIGEHLRPAIRGYYEKVAKDEGIELRHITQYFLKE